MRGSARFIQASPGTVWAHASVPVDMLGLILESVTGRTLDRFFDEEINAAIGRCAGISGAS